MTREKAFLGFGCGHAGHRFAEHGATREPAGRGRYSARVARAGRAEHERAALEREWRSSREGASRRGARIGARTRRGARAREPARAHEQAAAQRESAARARQGARGARARRRRRRARIGADSRSRAYHETSSATSLHRRRRSVLGLNIEDTDFGVLVSGVTPNGPAATAGVTAGDTIVSINDVELARGASEGRAARLRRRCSGKSATSCRATK